MEFKKLLDILPNKIPSLITDEDNLIEIIMDLGRPLLLKYYNRKTKFDNFIINQNIINEFENNLGQFGLDNRIGINGTLHRISKIQNRSLKTVGYTVRIGRVFDGSVDLIKDVLEAHNNILLIGSPGRGKTSLVRSISNYMSTVMDLSVVIVDSSNEIAGDGDILHPSVGDSRRLQVPFRANQHDVMIEAVENHMPDVIVVDEISSDQEAKAARTIAQRGVQLIATAHGNSLEDVLENPPLKFLVGNVDSVAVSDKLAMNLGAKFVTSRKIKPVFDCIIELKDFDEVWIYRDISEAIDSIITGGICIPEKRIIEDGVVTVIDKGVIKKSDPFVKQLGQLQFKENKIEVIKPSQHGKKTYRR